jgi:hypothetical protein
MLAALMLVMVTGAVEAAPVTNNPKFSVVATR